MILIAYSNLMEPLAAFCGVLNIYFAAHKNSWNWLFGIITVCFYLVIFFQVKLYADMCLQGVFLVMQFYGLQQWLQGDKDNKPLQVRLIPSQLLWVALSAILVLFVSLSYLLQHFTDSTTIYMDALITAISLVAQWMMCKKWLEHWWLWMIVDVLSVNLYLGKNLYYTGGLYGVLFFICVFGYRIWRRNLADGAGLRVKANTAVKSFLRNKW